MHKALCSRTWPELHFSWVSPFPPMAVGWGPLLENQADSRPSVKRAIQHHTLPQSSFCPTSGREGPAVIEKLRRGPGAWRLLPTLQGTVGLGPISSLGASAFFLGWRAFFPPPPPISDHSIWHSVGAFLLYLFLCQIGTTGSLPLPSLECTRCDLLSPTLKKPLQAQESPSQP